MFSEFASQVRKRSQDDRARSGEVHAGRPAGGGHIPYVPSLDGVRAMSITLVVAAHTLPLGPNHWAMNATVAPMGMALFFCLSGYLIVSMLYRDPDVPRFLIRRVMRILPAMALYLVFLAIFFQPNWQTILANLLFVSNYWHIGLDKTHVATSHLWSLSLEMQFYVAIALVVALLGRRGLWLVIPAALIVTWIRYETGPDAWVNIKTHLRVDEILSGGILALVSIHWGERIRAALSRPWLAWALLILVTVLLCQSSYYFGKDMNYARPYCAAAFVGVLIHARFALVTSILESRPAAYIARISYAVYIWHPILVFGWFNAGGDWLRYLVKRPISYMLLWIVAHLSTFRWEAYFQSLARRFTARAEATS